MGTVQRGRDAPGVMFHISTSHHLHTVWSSFSCHVSLLLLFLLLLFLLLLLPLVQWLCAFLALNSNKGHRKIQTPNRSYVSFADVVSVKERKKQAIKEAAASQAGRRQTISILVLIPATHLRDWPAIPRLGLSHTQTYTKFGLLFFGATWFFKSLI